MQVLPKRILLGITGGIAAYKSAELIRLLQKGGSEVRVVMSESAQKFITPLTLQTLSNHPVYKDLWDRMDHIALAEWADAIIIAPITAHHIAKLALGLADDLLTTLCLAAKVPLVVAPAMNPTMWHHETTQTHIELLKKRGVHVLGPEEGELACGENGVGRMMEPEAIVDALFHIFSPKIPISILITAGPTQEPLDPIRFISNRSSGKMGFALAEAASLKVEKVTLIAGPVHLPTPSNVTRQDVRTAEEMMHAVMKAISSHHIFIGCAAVSDYAAEVMVARKIKKQTNTMTLTLKKTPDILATVGALPKKPFLVGFAAETEQLLKNARQKLIKKNLDMIIANRVDAGRGFQSDDNEVTVLWDKGQKAFPRASKRELAHALVACILEHYKTVS